MGDPHFRGFNQAAGPWSLFKGVPGGVYDLYTDRQGVKLASTFGAGGTNGKSTFIRQISFTRGAGQRITAGVTRVGTNWVLQVTANGRRLGALQNVVIGGNISVQASPASAGRPTGVIITLPYLRIRVVQRLPYKPVQVRPNEYGSWLDVYLTILGPAPTPLGGLLGRTYRPPKVTAARPGGVGSAADGGGMPIAAFEFSPRAAGASG